MATDWLPMGAPIPCAPGSSTVAPVCPSSGPAPMMSTQGVKLGSARPDIVESQDKKYQDIDRGAQGIEGRDQGARVDQLLEAAREGVCTETGMKRRTPFRLCLECDMAGIVIGFFVDEVVEAGCVM